jgi:protein TonB
VPAYPPAARAGRFEGVVDLRVRVGEDGAVQELEVLRCDRGRLGFEESALAAVRTWRFRPAERDGLVVEAVTTLRVAFRAGRAAAGRGAYVTANGTPGADPVSVADTTMLARR